MTPYDWSAEGEDERELEGDWRVITALLVAFSALIGLLIVVL